VWSKKGLCQLPPSARLEHDMPYEMPCVYRRMLVRISTVDISSGWRRSQLPHLCIICPVYGHASLMNTCLVATVCVQLESKHRHPGQQRPFLDALQCHMEPVSRVPPSRRLRLILTDCRGTTVRRLLECVDHGHSRYLR
jgi:hypothetical protein